MAIEVEKIYAVLEHTADLQVRFFGKTKKKLFEHAVCGMFFAIKPKTEHCQWKQNRLVCQQAPVKRTIEISSLELDVLLIDFLSEALYLSDVHNEAYVDCHVHTLNDMYIKADVTGVPISGFEVVEIKAVTYHQLSIENTAEGYQADVVFDV